MQTEVTWETLDWGTLDRLRDTFITGEVSAEAYWTSRADVANYDLTFAQRIGWKWEAVLEELKLRGWTPPSPALLDWGCGSGIAARCVLDFFGAEQFKQLRVFDRSAWAMDFAVEKARKRFPQVQTEAVNVDWLKGEEPMGTLLLSHVLNELPAEERALLLKLAQRAEAIIWVEAGTHAVSRDLIAMRELLREQFEIIAPCTHQAACGMLVTGNERHWCHHFAKAPAGIMADRDWVQFAQRAGIDLRSLPYSFVVLEKKGLRKDVTLPEGFSHIIGSARMYKGFAKIFSCQQEGVSELVLQKRDEPGLFKALDKGKAGTIYKWSLEGEKIKEGEELKG